MLKRSVTLGNASAVLMGGALFVSRAVEAAPLANEPPSAAQVALIQDEQFLPLENVQYFYGGQNYCFYWNGWHGPGWY